jgi:hypothetical protein
LKKKEEKKESSGFDVNIYIEFLSNVKCRAEQLARIGSEVQQTRVIVRRKLKLCAVMDA